MDVFIYNTYRVFLKSALESRSDRNAHYSQAAFARDLGVTPARLSEILRAKRRISESTAVRWAESLGMRGQQRDYFLGLVKRDDARTEEERRVADIKLASLAKSEPYTELDREAFRVIADWYHYGILELTEVPGFQSEPKWIADQLQINRTRNQAYFSGKSSHYACQGSACRHQS